MAKAYIGYDLGDGETITDITVLDDDQTRAAVQTLFMQMTMPDNNTPGQALPTAFAFNEEGEVVFISSIINDPSVCSRICVNFKRRPSDLFGQMSEQRINELINLFNAKWPDSTEVPEADYPALMKFTDDVCMFTNAVFNDEKYLSRVSATIVNCDSVTICVGHPTKWNRFDVAIYRAILSRSILGSGTYAGKRSEIIMEAESRAAFLYMRDQTGTTILEKGQAAVLIDVGSSTIDVTATTVDSRNYLYNGGNNYIGARSIDFLIRDWYLEKLRKDQVDWETYQELIRENPTMEMALTLCCRKAKEDVYSQSAKRSRIYFADFPPYRVTQDEINDLITSRPIAGVLRETVGIPEDVAAGMGDKTWLALFRDFLEEQKKALTDRNISIGRIILTGSASKMPFVRDAVIDVFHELPDGGVLDDNNPSRSISMGLALIGTNDVKAMAFKEAVNAFIDEKLPEIVRKNIGELGEKIGRLVDNKVQAMVLNRVREWRDGIYRTIDDMTRVIQSDCSEENLNELLRNDPGYNEAIRAWIVDKVGNDIAMGLGAVCKKFGVTDITVDQLNVFTVPDVPTDDWNPGPEIPDVVMTIVSLVAGIVTYLVLPTVIGILIGLIAIISVDIASFLLAALLAIPQAGLVLLIAIGGIAVVRAVRRGLAGAREEILKKIQGFDLPKWSRKLITDDNIGRKFAQNDIAGKIRTAILSDDSVAKITANVTQTVSSQIGDRTDAIRYLIR